MRWILCCPPNKTQADPTLEPIARPVNQQPKMRKQNPAKGDKPSYDNTVELTAKAKHRELSPSAARREAQSEITPWELDT
ncbi:hypothetical protein M409DRAFT_31039 [Zasmidium cellare ATCC 36951]|uniref:Uncharacterized protein n=1 Tax=Zasmidium cellare ATCC 36951 TaxID=1080233 RepID=A0A6A6BUP0_ZASCE|nr:uncharacterized protein M409DRAFT_31039 [Zasmidium cellare ATCC 36951]KAF2158461.1 hypothetical protein M409DRAFT_31039 [Zasmidium cellare ATCC 36951]